MLALYIAGGIAVYCGIGVKCASKSVDISIRKEYSDDRTTSDAWWAFWLWPLWILDDGVKNHVLEAAEKRKEKKLLMAARQKEIETIISEEL